MLRLIKKYGQRGKYVLIICFFVAICLFFFVLHNAEKHVTINHATGVGDYWLARDLAQVIAASDYNVRVYSENADMKAFRNAQYNIVVRGNLFLIDFDAIGKKNILWLAWSNLKLNNIERTMPIDEYATMITDSIKKYDMLVIGSEKLYHILKDKIQIPLYFVPQFTNTEKFYPDYDEKLASEILFVGNYHFNRKAALMVRENNYPIKIYGDGWPQGVAVAEYIDNRNLRKYYSSAKIVLNDTKENMKDFGFISNRIFDATACKAFVISDYMPEIEKLYGDSVPMYKNKAELLNLLDYYLKHPEERHQKAERAYEITLKYRSHHLAQEYWKSILRQADMKTR